LYEREQANTGQSVRRLIEVTNGVKSGMINKFCRVCCTTVEEQQAAVGSAATEARASNAAAAEQQVTQKNSASSVAVSTTSTACPERGLCLDPGSRNRADHHSVQNNPLSRHNLKTFSLEESSTRYSTVLFGAMPYE